MGICVFLLGGIPTPLKNMKYEFVSWDDEIPNMMGKTKHVPNHQAVLYHLRLGIVGILVCGSVMDILTFGHKLGISS